MKTKQDFLVTNLPLQPSNDQTEHYAGHLLVDDVHDGYLFFWLFKSSNIQSNKIILWLNGGPGVSSLDGVLLEHGPFRINTEGKLYSNPYSWHQYAHILYVDQPKNAGFSFVSSPDGQVKSLLQMAKELKIFYQQFLFVFPELKANHSLILAGESFAGIYIPYILNSFQPDLPVEALLIGSPWISPQYQYGSLFQYAQKYHILPPNDSQEYLDIETRSKECQQKYQKNNEISDSYCDEIIYIIAKSFIKYKQQECLNMLNIQLRDSLCGDAWPPELQKMNQYLQREDVKESLHASRKIGKWKETNSDIYSALTSPAAGQNTYKMIQKSIKDLPVFLYAGELDLVSNHIGLYNAFQPFQLKTKLSHGTEYQKNLLYYTVIYNGSHMLSNDQPKLAFEYLKRVFYLLDHPNIITDSSTEVQSEESKEYGGPYYFFLILALLIIFGFIYFYFKRNKKTRRPPESIPLEVFDEEELHAAFSTSDNPDVSDTLLMKRNQTLSPTFSRK